MQVFSMGAHSYQTYPDSRALERSPKYLDIQHEINCALSFFLGASPLTVLFPSESRKKNDLWPPGHCTFVEREGQRFNQTNVAPCVIAGSQILKGLGAGEGRVLLNLYKLYILPTFDRQKVRNWLQIFPFCETRQGFVLSERVGFALVFFIICLLS